MKTLSFKFTPSVILPGQKANLVNTLPQLIVNSTAGKFTITAPVSKALGIAVGECVMFLDTKDVIEQELANNNAELLAYAEEKGYDITTAEGQESVVNDLRQYFIAKGQPMYKANGEPLTEAVRFTNEEKKKFIAEHSAEIIEANRAVLVERAGTPDATDEELAALITVDDIESPRVQSVFGSRTATTSNKTGVGLQLGFTDTNIWNNLKSDIDGDDKLKINRYFDVDLSAPIDAPFNNGKAGKEGNIIVKAYPLTYKEDKEVSRNFGRGEE